MPSDLEVRNALKVQEMLGRVEDILIEQVREDIFQVTELQTDHQLRLTVDVEETTVVLIMDVGLVEDFTVPGGSVAEELLRINNKAVHGKFCLDGLQVLFKDVLEVENLDQNELEQSMVHMFLTVAQTLAELMPQEDLVEA
jgi:hypothetical protein